MEYKSVARPNIAGQKRAIKYIKVRTDSVLG